MPDYFSKSFRYNGKQYNVKAKTEKECYEKIAEKKLLLKRGEIEPKTMTVKVWAEDWLETYLKPKVRKAGTEKRTGTMTQKSYEMYEEKLNNYIIPAVGTKKLADVTDRDLQRILNANADTSYSTVSKIRLIIKAMFRQAMASRLINYDPSTALTLPSAEKGRRRAITDEEREALLKVAKTHYAGLWIKFLMYEGLRGGELAALKVKDVDLDNELIYINSAVESGTDVIGMPKTKAGIRTLFIAPEILDELKAHIKGKAPDEFVFTQLDGKTMLTPTSMNTNWKSFCRQMDIEMGAEHTIHGHIYDPTDLFPDGTPMYPDPKDKTKPRNGHKLSEDFCMYNLRHTYCTDLGKHGVSAEDRKYLLGHSDIQVTLGIYTHPGTESALRAAKILKKEK